MNAASKGHLPIVLYLLTKQQADPLVRNNWGETAYDVAAAVFEIWICEVSDFAVRVSTVVVHTYRIGTATVRVREMARFQRSLQPPGGTYYCSSSSIREPTT